MLCSGVWTSSGSTGEVPCRLSTGLGSRGQLESSPHLSSSQGTTSHPSVETPSAIVFLLLSPPFCPLQSLCLPHCPPSSLCVARLGKVLGKVSECEKCFSCYCCEAHCRKPCQKWKIHTAGRCRLMSFVKVTDSFRAKWQSIQHTGG